MFNLIMVRCSYSHEIIRYSISHELDSVFNLTWNLFGVKSRMKLFNIRSRNELYADFSLALGPISHELDSVFSLRS